MINDDEVNGKDVCGLKFFKCKLEDGGMHNDELIYFKTAVTGHCLLLPLIEDGKEFNLQYAVVFDDWEVIGEPGKKGLPILSTTLYPAMI